MGAFQAEAPGTPGSGGGWLGHPELFRLKQSALAGKGHGRPVRVPPSFPQLVALQSRELGPRPLSSSVAFLRVHQGRHPGRGVHQPSLEYVTT